VRLILTVLAEGRAILSCEERLTERDLDALRRAVDDWQARVGSVLVLQATEVIRVRSAELDWDHRDHRDDWGDPRRVAAE
jgi:hypothetical protein